MISTLDLFCGGGGSSLGASQAGATIIGAVDAWDIAADTFADNFPDAQVRNLRLHRRSKSWTSFWHRQNAQTTHVRVAHWIGMRRAGKPRCMC
jgi:site-specific DNA-cytosine methylase